MAKMAFLLRVRRDQRVRQARPFMVCLEGQENAERRAILSLVQLVRQVNLGQPAEVSSGLVAYEASKVCRVKASLVYLAKTAATVLMDIADARVSTELTAPLALADYGAFKVCLARAEVMVSMELTAKLASAVREVLRATRVIRAIVANAD